MRFDAPVQAMVRTATEPVRLAESFPGARLVADAALEYAPNLIHRTPQRLQVLWE